MNSNLKDLKTEVNFVFGVGFALILKFKTLKYPFLSLLFFSKFNFGYEVGNIVSCVSYYI